MRSSPTSSGRRRSSRRLIASASGVDLSPYFSIGLGSGAVSALDMARAYATIANDGRRVDGSVFGNRPRVVESVARAPVEPHGHERPAPEAGHGRRARRVAHRPPRGRRSRRHGQARCHSGPSGRGQDGDDRQLRRRLVRRVHAGARRGGVGRLPGRAHADAHRVQRRARRWRHAPGDDLEGIRREDRRGRRRDRSTRRRTKAVRRRGSSAATASGSSTTATAVDHGSSPTSPARGPTTRPTASRTRSPSRSWSG